jgi:hypothetical protein
MPLGWMFLPLVGVVILGFVLLRGLDRVGPLHAARIAYAVLVVAAVATIPLGLFWSIGLLANLPVVGKFVHDFLHVNGVHSASVAWWGWLIGAWMLVSAWRAIALIRSHRKMGRASCRGAELVVDSDAVFAYAVPGPSRSIVLSRGLVATLTTPEVDVVVAHERAHARLCHDRALLVGHLCVLVLPLMRPVLARLEFALERIADESAVVACGSRQLVARTLARVALGDGIPRGVAGVAKTGVSARVLALQFENERRSTRAEIGSSLVVCTLLFLGVVQWYHVVAAVTTICTG